MSSRRDAEDWRGFRRPLALSSDSNERTSLTPAEVCFREAKRTSLLRALTSVFDPHLSNGVVLWNSANAANSLAWRETASAGAKLGVKLRAHEVRSAKNFGNAFRQIVEQHP